jgi:ribonuclease HI
MDYVYTDGACSNNGKKNAKAGIGIYFGHDDPRNVSQRIEGKQTNNTAELGAILHVYTILEKDILSGKKIGIVTDSIYAIRCATTYGKK